MFYVEETEVDIFGDHVEVFVHHLRNHVKSYIRLISGDPQVVSFVVSAFHRNSKLDASVGVFIMQDNLVFPQLQNLAIKGELQAEALGGTFQSLFPFLAAGTQS